MYICKYTHILILISEKHIVCGHNELWLPGLCQELDGFSTTTTSLAVWRTCCWRTVPHVYHFISIYPFLLLDLIGSSISSIVFNPCRYWWPPLRSCRWPGARLPSHRVHHWTNPCGTQRLPRQMKQMRSALACSPSLRSEQGNIRKCSHGLGVRKENDRGHVYVYVYKM